MADHTRLEVRKVAEADFPTEYGHFRIYGFEARKNGAAEEAVALVMGDPRAPAPPLVRIHSRCLTGDVFHSLRCDCRAQLELSLEMIAAEGRGIVVYESEEGRGIGLLNKLRAYRLQEDGLDTVEANERLGLPADLRDYGIGAQILVDLGLGSIRILTNNPKKIRGLEGYGLSVSGQIPIEHAPNEHNEAYLRTKAQRMGHTLHHQGLNLDEELLRTERKRTEPDEQ
jgi:3,4-dihydroxy 2-butanone 4-phosphate synthase/GTP cyclohydrolase II